MTAAGPLQAGDPPWLGPYEVLGRLGEGGQSVVFLGRRRDGLEVAIKLLRAQLSRNPEWRARFERELALIGRVAGFCTAQVLDADVSGEMPYVVSEYVTGPPLSDLVRGSGPRTGTDLDRLAVGTVTALAAIHRAGIAHRDLKPSNVLMGPDGPRVIDFGIARALDGSASRGSGVVGTPSYMAPEQVADAELGASVDLFAWGSTMLFAATGRPPFGNDAISSVFHRIINEEPDLSALPDPLRGIVAACVAKDPARRPDAQQVLLDLLGRQVTLVPSAAEGALSTGASFAGAPDPAETVPPRPRRRMRWVALAAAAVVALGGGGTAWALMDGESSPGGTRPSTGTASPPAAASAALPEAAAAVKAVLSFDYRRIDRDVATAHARVTDRYRAEYDRQLESGSWRARLRDNQSTVTTVIAASAVVNAAPERVTVLGTVRRTVRSTGAEPDLLEEPMRVTMVRRGGKWLLDTLYVLQADSVPAGASGRPWPGDRAGRALAAVRRHPTVTSGTLVEAALRAAGSKDELTALVAVGACTKGTCKSTDEMATHVMRLRRTADGWQVAGSRAL